MPLPSRGSGSGWSQEQLNNAAIIYRVGRSMGLGIRDIQIGIITAIVESGLRNVPYGDRDSLGLFQQRPSQGWGTAAQVQDPVYAARKFFSALKGLGSRRLSMGMGEAAQAVQRSAFPDRYAEHIGQARDMFPTIEKLAGGKPLDMDGNDYQIPGASPEPLGGMALDLGASIEPTQFENPVTPEGMLGAWGFDMEDGGATFIGAGTDGLIQQIREESSGVPYTKGVSGWRKAVIEYAQSALGKPYVWGGTDLSSGVDCSGLLYAAFAKAGMDIPRVSYAQANYGTRTGMKGLRPGDLWAWDNSSRNNGADHIALYIGNGQILESPRPGGVVRIRKLDPSEGGWGVHLNL